MTGSHHPTRVMIIAAESAGADYNSVTYQLSKPPPAGKAAVTGLPVLLSAHQLGRCVDRGER